MPPAAKSTAKRQGKQTSAETGSPAKKPRKTAHNKDADLDEDERSSIVKLPSVSSIHSSQETASGLVDIAQITDVSRHPFQQLGGALSAHLCFVVLSDNRRQCLGVFSGCCQ